MTQHAARCVPRWWWGGGGGDLVNISIKSTSQLHQVDQKYIKSGSTGPKVVPMLCYYLPETRPLDFILCNLLLCTV